MGINSALGSALSGIKTGLENAARHAEEISTAYLPEGSGDIVDAAIGLKLDTQQVKANAKVIKVVGDTTGSILDILA